MEEEFVPAARSALNLGDDALVDAMTMFARIVAMHMEDGEPFIADLRDGYLQLAKRQAGNPIHRSIHMALAHALQPLP